MFGPVYVHAGAHRTGTSSFQMCLSVNRETLEAKGFDLAYPGRDGAPGGRLRLQLPRPRHGEKRIPAFGKAARTHLETFSTGEGRAMILSEENIPGLMRHFYDGKFFPGSGKRLAALAGALEQPPAHVVYVIRAYAGMFVSAYRKRAEDNPVDPFSDVVPKFLNMDRGWPELVAEFAEHLRPGKLTVVPYERRGTSRELLARLVPDLDPDELQEPDREVNVSATDAALEVLQARYQAGEKLPREEWQTIIDENASHREDRGFASFSDDAMRQLAERYIRDMGRVAELPGVEFA